MTQLMSAANVQGSLAGDHDPHALLPRTMRAIQAGFEAGISLGAQVYVSLDAAPVADFGVGEARPGVPMSPGSMMAWYSATKAALPIAMSQLWERGLVEWDDLVCKHVPEYGTKGKEVLTIRHLVTHTAGVLNVPGIPGGLAQPNHLWRFDNDWSKFIATVCEASREPDWAPGQRAAYMGGNNYSILGEIVQRIAGERYATYVRRNIFEPIGALDCWIGMPPGKYEEYGERIGLQNNIGKDGVPKPIGFLDSAASSLNCHAGGNGRGPISGLARLYEVHLLRGSYKGQRIISPQSSEAVTARHRTGIVDERFGAVVNWGLGYVIDRIQFGRHCSQRTFGHGGGANSEAFCDPEKGLVVGVVFNGNIRGDLNARRMESVATAIYEDLGLVREGDPGRDHAMPTAQGE